MPLETDLSVFPYFDDHQPEKDFQQILFRPGVSVQTRELNQLQTLLYAQIERFGDNILAKGTILEGCNFRFVAPYPYVKLLDNEVNGTIALPNRYVGYYARNSANLQAVIINSADGFESTDPDLKTVFVHYNNAGLDNNTHAFSPGDLLTIFDPRNSLFSISVENGGINFSNSDTVVITSAISVNVATGSFSNGEYIVNPITGANVQIVGIDDLTLATLGQVILRIQPRNADLINATANSSLWTLGMGDSIRNVGNSATATIENIYGFNANASLVTDGTGRVTNVNININGRDYSQIPTVRIKSSNNSVGLAALSLTAINYLATIRVANTGAAVGNGYAFGVTEGVIYQKGRFLRVDDQLVIVSKYSTSPNNISVGFYTREEIIDSNQDTSLLDNATGEENEFAPGANRLRMTPELVTVNSTVSLNSTFLPIVSFSEGNPFRLQQTTAYSKINDEMARRDRDAHGTYTLDKFLVTTRSPYTSSYEGNTFSVVVDPGTSYIQGYRVETLRNFVLDVQKGIDTETGLTTQIPLNYRNYIRIKEVGGVFQFSTGDTVDLYDTAKHFLSNTQLSTSGNTTPQGNKIGTARIRSMTYESGFPGSANAAYRLYLFNVAMNTGKNFADVRSVYYNNTYKGIADIILELDPTTSVSVAEIHYPSQDKLLFPAGVESLQNAANTSYVYRTIDQTVTFSNTGVLTKSIAAVPNEFYPYFGALTQAEMEDLYVVPLANLQASANLAGTVSINTTSNVMVGTGTSFITDLVAGDYVYLYANSTVNDVRQVVAVANNTRIQLDANADVANATMAIYRYFPGGVPIPFGSRDGLTASVDANSNILTCNLGMSLTGSTSTNAALAVNIERQSVDAGTKTASRDQYVKLCLANNAEGVNGPWCLGVPDIIRLTSVYVSNSSTVNAACDDIVNDFYIDHNQTQNYYDLGWLFRKSQASRSLDANTWLLVKFDCLTISNTGFFDSVSYVGGNVQQQTMNDGTPLANLGSAINTWEVPEVYDSKGNYYDLLNQFDFRPAASNTAVLTTNVDAATINPANTLSFGNTANPANDKKFPLPDSLLETTITQYQGRVDAVYIGKDGNVFTIKGVPSGSPSKRYLPNQPQNSLRLNAIFIPAYPDLPQNIGNVQIDILNTRIANERYSFTRRNNHSISTLFTAGQIENNQPTRYTMQDIGSIDRRVRALEYYASLSLLETDMVNRVIPSSVDPGQNRFKFGFYADDFSSNVSQEISNPQYNADIVDNKLVPKRYFWTVTTGSNGVISSNYVDWPIVVQPWATFQAGNNCICLPNGNNTTTPYSFTRVLGNTSTIGSNSKITRESVDITYGAGKTAIYFATDYGYTRFVVYKGNTVLITSDSAVGINTSDAMDKVAIADPFFAGFNLGSVNLTRSNNYVSGHGKIILPLSNTTYSGVTVEVTKGTNSRDYRWMKVSPTVPDTLMQSYVQYLRTGTLNEDDVLNGSSFSNFEAAFPEVTMSTASATGTITGDECVCPSSNVIANTSPPVQPPSYHGTGSATMPSGVQRSLFPDGYFPSNNYVAANEGMGNFTPSYPINDPRSQPVAAGTTGDFINTTDRTGEQYSYSQYCYFQIEVKVVATGLKPNTRHWFYFNGSDKTPSCLPWSVQPGNMLPGGGGAYSVMGGDLISDSSGRLQLTYYYNSLVDQDINNRLYWLHQNGIFDMQESFIPIADSLTFTVSTNAPPPNTGSGVYINDVGVLKNPVSFADMSLKLKSIHTNTLGE